MMRCETGLFGCSKRKYRNFTLFPGVEISWKHTVSAEFRAIRPKLCRNSAFPQNFHTRKLGEITGFFGVVQSFYVDHDSNIE